MDYPTGSWRLEGFPEQVGDAPGEVEKAYAAWLESCRRNPRTRAQRLQGDDVRYTAEVPNAVFSDGHGGWKLMCDFEVHESDLPGQGRVVFVEMGFAEGDDLREQPLHATDLGEFFRRE